MLLNGDFTFCPVCDFNELAVAKKFTRQLLRDQLHNEPRTTALREQDSRASKSLGMPSRNCFDLFVNEIVARAGDRISTDIVVPEFRREATDRPVSDHACRTMFEKVRARLDPQATPTAANELFFWAAAQDDPQPPLSQSDLVL
jgi:hypothetical protein